MTSDSERAHKRFVIGYAGWVLLSPVIAILVHVFGACLSSATDSAGGMRELVDREAEHVNSALGGFARLPGSLAEAAHRAISTSVSEPVGSEHLSYTSKAAAATLDPLAGKFVFVEDVMGSAIEAATLAVWLVFLRIGILAQAFPVFALAALIGVADGWTIRYLRRVGGARESSASYHRAKQATYMIVAGVFIVYLSIPYPLDPRIALFPPAVAFAIALRTAIGQYKKYR